MHVLFQITVINEVAATMLVLLGRTLAQRWFKNSQL